MHKINNFSLHTAELNDSAVLNQQLMQGLTAYTDDSETRKSHHFFGRYENIYIGSDKIPALANIIDAAIAISAEILHCSVHTLKAGLWFNVMNPGDKTTLHQHDDDDELLSAVYYIQVAENSGTLHLGKPPVQTQVTPAEGLFVFFPPNMPHEVSENLSSQCRISLGINIGPIDMEDDADE